MSKSFLVGCNAFQCVSVKLNGQQLLLLALLQAAYSLDDEQTILSLFSAFLVESCRSLH